MTRKIVSAFFALLLCLSLTVAASAASDRKFVLDGADLLTSGEEAELSQTLSQISDRYHAQVLVVTMDTLGGNDIDSFVDYLYDSQAYGYGANRDGVLLLIAMDVREYRILSNGYPGVAIDERNIQNISDAIVPDLSDGDYFDAFQRFAAECDYYLDGYHNGFPFDFSGTLIISLIIGLVAGLVTVLILWSQLKTVHKQNQAAVYVKDGSMKLNVQRDLYLYRTLTRTKKETSSSSGRSGGSARSKGGGSF